MANRYNSGDRNDITTPVKPSWCFEEDGSGEEDEQPDANGFRKRKKRRREIIKKDAKFVIETPLVTVAHSPIREEVQEACQIICGWERYVCNTTTCGVQICNSPVQHKPLSQTLQSC